MKHNITSYTNTPIMTTENNRLKAKVAELKERCTSLEKKLAQRELEIDELEDRLSNDDQDNAQWFSDYCRKNCINSFFCQCYSCMHEESGGEPCICATCQARK